MRKIKIITSILIIIFLVVIGTMSSIAQNKILSVGTGRAGGTQYLYISAIGNIINKYVDDINWNMEISTGSVNNLSLLQNREFDMAFAEQSTSYEFYNKGYQGQPLFKEVRAILPCYTQDFLVSTTDPDIKNLFEDFKGKVCRKGDLGGSQGESQARIAELFPDDLEGIIWKEYTWSESFNEMGEGNFDALWGVYGQPSNLIYEYNANPSFPPLYHPELSEEKIEKIVEAYPYYSKNTLNKDMYKSFKEDYHTFGNWAFIYTHKDMGNDVVYETLRGLFENIDELYITLPSTKNTTVPENILNSIIPLHVGAIKYYEEIGLEVPEELYPPEYER